MWVFEEEINGKKLSEIINTDHENVKYLPNIKLPTNVVAVPDLITSVKDSTILVFVIPHQFLAKVCRDIKEYINPKAKAISLIKVKILLLFNIFIFFKIFALKTTY